MYLADKQVRVLLHRAIKKKQGWGRNWAACFWGSASADLKTRVQFTGVAEITLGVRSHSSYLRMADW